MSTPALIEALPAPQRPRAAATTRVSNAALGAVVDVYTRGLLDRFVLPALAVLVPVAALGWAVIAPSLVELDGETQRNLYLATLVSLAFSIVFLAPWWQRRGMKVTVHQGGLVVRKNGTDWQCLADEIDEIWRCTNAVKPRDGKPRDGKPQKGITIVRNDGTSVSIGTALSGWRALRDQLEEATFAKKRDEALALVGAGLSVSFGYYRVNLHGVHFAMATSPSVGTPDHSLAWSEVEECKLEGQWLRLKKHGVDWRLVTSGTANFHVMTAVVHELWWRSRRTSYIPGR